MLGIRNSHGASNNAGYGKGRAKAGTKREDIAANRDCNSTTRQAKKKMAKRPRTNHPTTNKPEERKRAEKLKKVDEHTGTPNCNPGGKGKTKRLSFLVRWSQEGGAKRNCCISAAEIARRGTAARRRIKTKHHQRDPWGTITERSPGEKRRRDPIVPLKGWTQERKQAR